MATEKQSQENAALGQSAGLGAYNNTSQPQSEQPASELELKRFDRPSVKGDELANAFGVGAFKK